MSAPLILEVADLRKDYAIRSGLLGRKHVHHAVDGVSFSVREGETLGIVGESGCGKSTVAKLVLGLVPPTGGQIHYVQREVSDYARMDLTRLVQPIFQDPYSSLNPRARVIDIVMLPLLVHGASSAQARQDATEMLDRVGLPGAGRAYPRQLSGGQRQRVAIARALVIKPRLVICDEPTSALDVSVQAQVLDLLVELQNAFGLSYVFISHNLSVVEHIADRVAVMFAGKIVETGPCTDVFSAPVDSYTRKLLSSSLDPFLILEKSGLVAADTR